jgi:endonuclease YncB( thermonuclease family)
MMFDRIGAVRRWNRRPSLGRTGTRLVGITPVIVVLLSLALGIHAYNRTAPVPRTHGDIAGRAWVIDGDTVDIAGTRIRLEGIDAPESDQTCTDADRHPWPCGRAATRELREHIGGRQLRCQTMGTDFYRRTLAVCALPDGSDLNAWMVRQGWALAYGYSGLYRAEEAQAQAGKRGIWAGNFTAPWEWRRRHVE